MRKNKGLFFVVATLLAVTCLLVSCNSEVSDNASGDKGLAYITFDGGNSKRITQNTITEAYELVDINELYWVYSATKADLGGASGQTTAARVNNTTGLSGVIGGFSKGLWDFGLTGWKYKGTGTPEASIIPTEGDDWDKIFAGSAAGVLLNNGTQLNPDPINVNVNFVPTGEGTLVIDSDFIFQWQYDSAGTSETVGNNLKLKIDVEGLDNPFLYDLTRGTENNEVVYRLSGDQTEEVPAGDYVVTASVIEVFDENTTLVYSIYENINVKIYAGQTTRITAEMLEGEFAAGQFNAIIESVDTQTVTASVPVTFTSSYTPASVTSGNVDANAVTTVEFEADALTATETTDEYYKLTVAVSDFATAQSKFVVSNATSAASLDLDLKKISDEGSTPVSSFENNKYAVITTYIATGLTGVKVEYNGNDELDDAIASDSAVTNVAAELSSDSGLGYNPATGYLSFKTNHFSEYYVTTTSVAYNSTKGKAYESLKAALAADEVGAGDYVMLLKDVTISLADKMGTTSFHFGNENRSVPAALMIYKSITLDGNNHSINVDAYSGYYSTAIAIEQSNIEFTLKNITIGTPKTSTIHVSEDKHHVNLNVIGCTLGTESYVIKVCNGADNLNINITDSVLNGWSAFNLRCNDSVITVNNSELTGVNNKTQHPSNDYATIVFDGDTYPDVNHSTTVDTSGAHGTHNTLSIINSRINASSLSSNEQYWLSLQYGAKNNEVTVDGLTVFGCEIIPFQNENNTFINNNVSPVAYQGYNYTPGNTVIVDGVTYAPNDSAIVDGKQYVTPPSQVN